jgi:hypothetical protein
MKTLSLRMVTLSFGLLLASHSVLLAENDVAFPKRFNMYEFLNQRKQAQKQK